jgi:hypothetical protein
MRLQYVIMVGLTRTPKSMDKLITWMPKMQKRIYLGHPCRVRLYHLIMTRIRNKEGYVSHFDGVDPKAKRTKKQIMKKCK